MVVLYHIDPSKYSLQKMKSDLLTRELIPSRLPLKNGLETSFQKLEDLGIQTLKDLITALRNKQVLGELSTSTGIDEKYLTLLRREANSYLPNPVSLDKFSGFTARDLDRLAAVGIKNSRHLFERIVSEQDLGILAAATGINPEILTSLLNLSDLVRAYGVGPVFARILYDTGIHSIRQLRSYSPRQVVELYQEKTGKKADFSISDIGFSLELIQVLDIGE